MRPMIEAPAVSAGGIIINPRAEIVLVRERKKVWEKGEKVLRKIVSFPKGKVEEEDADEEAAFLREVWEETGLTAGRLKILGLLGYVVRMNADGSEQKKILFYLAQTNYTGKLKPNDKHILEAMWCDRRHVADLLHHPQDKEFYQTHITRKFLRELGVL